MDSSDDEANSDGEDQIETEHNVPSRNSHNPTSNRNSNIVRLLSEVILKNL
jgi:hypothetical protein